MAGPAFLIYDKVTGALTHVSNDPTAVAAFTKAGAAALDWPTLVYPTMAVVPGNVNTGVNVPTLVPVSAADLPVPAPPAPKPVTSAGTVSSGGTVSGGGA